MIYNNVAEIYEATDKIRTRLLTRAASLSEDEKSARSSDDAWSVAEIFEHLGIVEAGLIRILEKFLPQAESRGAQSDGIFNPPVSFLEQAKAAGDRKFEAPKMVCPQGAQTVDESLAKLRESRQRLHDLRSRIEAVDLSETTFPHPAFGNLNLYQWLIVTGLHEKRHLAQIEGILASRKP